MTYSHGGKCVSVNIRVSRVFILGGVDYSTWVPGTFGPAGAPASGLDENMHEDFAKRTTGDWGNTSIVYTDILP